MRGLLLILALAAPAWAAPKLLVVIAVDQMRAEDFDGPAAASYAAGLKTLYKEGAVFVRAFHRHIPTETAPGHAAILTGQMPDRHGIVGNEWYDEAAGVPVYAASDDLHGHGPQRLLSYTLGDALKARHPLSRVVALSMKDRSAIFLGGKKADLALWYDKQAQRFVTSSYYGQAPGWLEPFNRKLKAKDMFAMDRALLDLAEETLSRMRLGEGPHPDILAISFSATDYVGHRYGPGSPQQKRQLRNLDIILGELVGMLKVSLGQDFALVLTSDHGVIPAPESPEGQAKKAKRVRLPQLGKDIERTLQTLHPAPGRKWVARFSFPHLYLNRELSREQGLDWPVFLREAAARVRGLGALAAVYVPGEWDPNDPYSEAFERSYFPGRSGHLLLRPKEWTLLAEYKTGTEHGSPYRYDAHVPLVFWGPEFRTGLYGHSVGVTDLAPTCAHILGVPLPAPGSRVLSEALAQTR